MVITLVNERTSMRWRNTPVQTGFIAVDGAQLYYEVAGAETTPALAFIHPAGVDCRVWMLQFYALAEKYRVIRYDLRNLGRSNSRPGRYFYHEDLSCLLQGLRVEQTYLVGLAGGAAIALDFALEYPECVRALILVSPTVSGSRQEVYSEEEKALLLRLNKAEEAAEFMLRKWVVGPKRPREVVQPSVYTQTARLYQDTFSRNEILPVFPKNIEPPASTRLRAIKQPTLIVCGACDMDTILENAALLAEDMPRARKVLLPDVGHFVNLEASEIFNRLLCDFIAIQ